MAPGCIQFFFLRPTRARFSSPACGFCTLSPHCAAVSRGSFDSLVQPICFQLSIHCRRPSKGNLSYALLIRHLPGGASLAFSLFFTSRFQHYPPHITLVLLDETGYPSRHPLILALTLHYSYSSLHIYTGHFRLPLMSFSAPALFNHSLSSSFLRSLTPPSPFLS